MKTSASYNYTPEQIDYLREIGDQTDKSNEEIKNLFNKKFNTNRTLNAIVQAKCRYGIRSYTRKYTEEQIDYLKEITPGKTRVEILELFNEKFKDNRTIIGIKSIMHDKGIRMSSDGRFKKGDMPSNYHPVGTETMREDGYIYIKIKDPNVWKQKHHIIWEKENGPIPEGHAVLFGDGDRTNFDIDNLILVSKYKVLQLNRYDLIGNDADITKTGILITDIYQKISERKKGRKANVKQDRDD